MRIHDEVRKMPVSPIREWTSRLHALGPKAELTLGEPVQNTDPRIVEAAAAALRQGLTHYPPAAGLVMLQEQLAQRERELRGWTFQPQQILITNGAQEALAVCSLALLNPGDEALLCDPGYPGTASVVRLASAVPVPCPADAQLQPDAARMERSISVRTRAIILASPNNPTGQVVSAAVLDQLGALAEKYDLALIVDAAYEQLCWQPLNFKTLRAVPPPRDLHRQLFQDLRDDGLAVRLDQRSPPLADGDAENASGVSIGGRPLCAEGRLYGADAAGRFLAAADSAAMRTRRPAVKGNRLGLSVARGGGFYCFPSIRNTGLSGEQFALKLAEQAGVAVLPGSLFGARGAQHVRLSVGVDRETLDWALDQIEKFVKAGG